MSATILDLESLAAQLKRMRQQVADIQKEIGKLHIAGDLDSVHWSACNAYLHAAETPLGMAADFLRYSAEKVTKELAAVAADPRA